MLIAFWILYGLIGLITAFFFDRYISDLCYDDWYDTVMRGTLFFFVSAIWPLGLLIVPGTILRKING